jgi:hypothetical protein
MKQKTIFILAFMLVSALLFSQEKDKPCDVLPDAVLKYLDPDYPVFINTGDKFADNENYRNAVKSYARQHPPFPVYVNNGNPEEDQIAFENAKQIWFAQNPFFPQYIDTGNPPMDVANYNLACREWKNHFQREYKELFNAIYEDSELREKYSFIIQN